MPARYRSSSSGDSGFKLAQQSGVILECTGVSNNFALRQIPILILLSY